MNVFIPVVCKTSEAGHAVGMEKLVMQLQYFMDRRKIVLDSKMKANFYHKVMVFSKKKKGLHLKSVSFLSLFVPKSQCSLKKKVFASDQPQISLILSQNCGVLYSVKK